MKISMIISVLFLYSFFTSAQSITTSNNVKNGKYTIVDENNNSKELNYVNGQLHGDVLVYNEEGTLIEKHQYLNGKRHGEWTYWNGKGQKMAVLHYDKGVKHGKWEIFFDGGITKALMYYHEGSKTGTWKNFNKEQVLLAEKDYGLPEPSTALLIDRQ